MQSNEPNFEPSGGFQQSSARSLGEVLLILVTLAAVVGGVVFVVSRLAGWLMPVIPTAVDDKVGSLAFEAHSLQSTKCSAPDTQKYVESLMAQMVAASDMPTGQVTVVVVENDVPNAFALPGGYVVVHHGLLSLSEDGAEVAAVLAHEWAHVTHRHGMRRVLRSAGTGVALGLLLGGTDVGVLAGYAEDLAHLSYDRDQEREADATGRATLKKAGVDPSAMGRFFLRLKEKHGGPDVPTFLSTHPDLAERAASAEQDERPSTLKVLPSPQGLRCQVAEKDEGSVEAR